MDQPCGTQKLTVLRSSSLEDGVDGEAASSLSSAVQQQQQQQKKKKLQQRGQGRWWGVFVPSDGAPLDGGFGWAVVAASFLLHFMALGLVYSIGSARSASFVTRLGGGGVACRRTVR